MSVRGRRNNNTKMLLQMPDLIIRSCGLAAGEVKLGSFGFVFGFGGWLRKALLQKRLGRFCASRGGANRGKLALFGFALSRETKCPIGRKFLLCITLGAFDFFGNWLCFFK